MRNDQLPKTLPTPGVLYKQLPRSLRPSWYPSDIPFIRAFEQRFRKLWPWEMPPFTRPLERLYQQLIDLEGEEEAQRTMLACLTATRVSKVRGDPKTSPHARYLYRVLEAQVKGQSGEPGYSKRSVNR